MTLESVLMTDPATTIQIARDALAELMSSPEASQEYLTAMGHMDQALRVLDQRTQRLIEEQERARIEEEAQANGTYDTFEEDPRDDEVPTT